MSRGTLRTELYRAFQSQCVKPLLFPIIFKKGGERTRIFTELLPQIDPTQPKASPTGWFHASSVGELEMMVPVIEAWARLHCEGGARTGVVLTIFSESAEDPLRKLAGRLKDQGARVLFAGYSPWEGEWRDVLARIDPEFVMTARYEAWPELWISLSAQEIPLVVVGAKARSSLRWASRICGALGQELPRTMFLTVEVGDIAELSAEFPNAEVIAAGDPRWERVIQRSIQGSPRARELIEANAKAPRPWGVLGSVWSEDLGIFRSTLRERKFRGTLWLVPHKIDESSLRGIESALRESRVSFRRSSELEGAAAQVDCIVVNEMGFLAELYSAADWAYVGGGFSGGVHNTIEPAIYGIPVCCGPRRADRFPEISVLNSYGQLEKIENADELAQWLNHAQDDSVGKQRVLWRDLAQKQLGASERILSRVLAGVSGWKLQK